MFREYHVNVYKLPWGKPFFGFLTVIHPDRHAGTTFLRQSNLSTNGLLVVKSC